MTSDDALPSPRLRSFVQLFWCLELAADLAPSAPERIAPDGVVEVVFHYRDPMAMRFAGQEPATQPRSFAVTLTRRFVEISRRGSTGFVAVRFRPWGAHRFLALPVSELADRVVSAEELWGGAVGELEERLAGAATTAERVALIEEFLLDKLHDRRDRPVEPLVRAIWRRRGDLRVSDLCVESGLAERSLERLFAKALGMPPKSYIRLTRFLHACSELRRGDRSSLARLAVDCGYYDQAHFIADVRAFSGMVPGDLASATDFSFLEPD